MMHKQRPFKVLSQFRFIAVSVSVFFVSGSAFAQNVKSTTAVESKIIKPTNDANQSRILLPNGWSLSPAGRSLPLGDLPLNMALSHNEGLLAVTNNGYGKQTIQLFDPKSEKLLDQKPISKAWYGLRFGENDKVLYVSGGNDNIILAYHISDRKLGKADTILLGKPWPEEKISPTGIDVDNHTNRLYTVTKENNALYIIDLNSKSIIKKISLGHEAYACQLSPDKKNLYISLWGGDKLIVFDTKNERIKNEITTQSHPNDIICTKNGKYLFVANANDNSVQVISTQTYKVIETISASLFPTKLTGSTTNGLCLSPDEKTLYIANADNNCLAVFNVANPGISTSKGFIPTGWYPTNVKAINNKILVSNGKGFASMANPQGPQPIKKSDNSTPQQGINGHPEVQYIGGLFNGTLSFIDLPTTARLSSYTKQVYDNTPFKQQSEKEAEGIIGNPIPQRAGEKSPIKHVFYVIKENRTYDQIMGDVKEGNGESSFCIFPEKVTPNHHAIAKQFVLLDNFYVDAEVSCDGHNWSTAAYATDYTEKTWPTLYGKRGGTYDYEGTRAIAFPRDGYIWDYCKRAGVSYRSYGEFATNGKATVKSLEGHFCRDYPGFNLDIKDVFRVKVWKRDFDSLMTKDAVPALSIIRLPNDHTSGQKKGKISPIATVADNDLALGQLIEHLSQSSIWKESAIFVLEDDAQNGPDHVDAHRSPAYIISPYLKMGYVDRTMYSTSGILRTMELILGLPPMSQYDAAALPLFNCFTAKPNLNTYKTKEARVSLDERNTAWNKSAKRSELFNLAKEDAAPDLDLNEVVWKSVKGEDSVMPAPKRSAFVVLEANKKEDDD